MYIHLNFLEYHNYVQSWEGEIITFILGTRRKKGYYFIISLDYLGSNTFCSKLKKIARLDYWRFSSLSEIYSYIDMTTRIYEKLMVMGWHLETLTLEVTKWYDMIWKSHVYISLHTLDEMTTSGTDLLWHSTLNFDLFLYKVIAHRKLKTTYGGMCMCKIRIKQHTKIIWFLSRQT